MPSRAKRGTHAAVALVAGVVLAAAALSAAASPPHAAARAAQRTPHTQTTARTIATIYEAFSYHGVVVPHVQVEPGYCTGSSQATLRLDAWRCSAGATVLDPCFNSEFANGVVCPSPATDTGVEINLTRPLPKASNHAAPSLTLAPWAITTASGASCAFATGSSPVIASTKTRMNYVCSAKLGLWGYPNRKSTTWTILVGPPTAKSLSRRVAIVHAWM
jgi:hypothetical protein